MYKITASDLQYYIGLPCAIYELNNDGTINKDIDPAPAYIEGVDEPLNKIIAERIDYEPIQVKPILTNLEELTIEDTVHMSCEILGYDKGTKEEHIKWHENDLKEIREYGFIQFATSDSIFMPKIILYLIKKGYDLHLLPSGSYLIYNKNGRAFETD